MNSAERCDRIFDEGENSMVIVRRVREINDQFKEIAFEGLEKKKRTSEIVHLESSSDVIEQTKCSSLHGNQLETEEKHGNNEADILWFGRIV
jgi:hypothetical protein